MADSINYQLAKFVASYGKVSQIPESTCPEVSFVGRSNVGKSSIMNKLFGRKNLVKVSSTPGKTSNINFFEADDVHFVDLPGYGFARRSKAERDRWAELIGDFFDSERSFNLVVSLVDIRHDPSKLDHDMIDYLQGNEFNFIVCLTKADKLSRTQQARQAAAIKKQLNVPAENVIITSSQTGIGIDELKSASPRPASSKCSLPARAPANKNQLSARRPFKAWVPVDILSKVGAGTVGMFPQNHSAARGPLSVAP